PRLNEVLVEARKRGVLIIHAPSGNVDFYKDTPARRRCAEAPKVKTKVPLKWNDLDPDREPPLPIDTSKGGWEGPRTEGRPQTRQHPAIAIDDKVDGIGSTADVYYLLEQRGIENVILTGVHTNFCVLGRPFGIRQMTYLGKRVFLMRDMTDCLYNPKHKPYVNHFRGTELVVEHIEKYWCPTFTSTSILNRPEFHFKEDKRPHVVFIVSDDHYHADKTLPPFAQMLREKYNCRATVLHGQHESRIPDAAQIDGADSVVVFVRRLLLPKEELGALRRYVKAGRPLVGLRTASHAFASKYKYPKGYKTPAGNDEWPEFDAEVLGGSYHSHGPNALGTDVANVAEMADHPILAGVKPAKWHSTGSLYYTSPIDKKATLLQTGSAMITSKETKKKSLVTEPLTWTRTHNGGRVVYTGLGHRDDFEVPQFRKLLLNSIFWAMDRPVTENK
ncbi:MAG: ThuA domain-containing protein, partial [Pirellulales bacterium]|nr:ThuA domain-containing protein [Pirellulales bacterium]